MKTLLMQAFALGHPLRFARMIEERFRRSMFLKPAWLRKKKSPQHYREMVNNPGNWDIDWFNHYE